MRLIVGLGNPGREYDGTRHNIGFEVVDKFASSIGVSWGSFKKGGAVASLPGKKGFLLKPLEYMNRSGFVVREFLQFYKIPLEEMVVVHDELDIPRGDLRLKFGGGEAGHNGLRSISEQLGSREYWRFRFGIGKPGSLATSPSSLGGELEPVIEVRKSGEGVVNWVLGRFSQIENSDIVAGLDRSLKILAFSVEHPLKETQQQMKNL